MYRVIQIMLLVRIHVVGHVRSLATALPRLSLDVLDAGGPVRNPS